MTSRRNVNAIVITQYIQIHEKTTLSNPRSLKLKKMVLKKVFGLISESTLYAHLDQLTAVNVPGKVQRLMSVM